VGGLGGLLGGEDGDVDGDGDGREEKERRELWYVYRTLRVIRGHVMSGSGSEKVVLMLMDK
jgi:hypothetical protein